MERCSSSKGSCTALIQLRPTRKHTHDPACVDLMWYLWCGAKSPLFGKERMTSFERCFVDPDCPGAAELRKEPKDPYDTLCESEDTVRKILTDFGLDPDSAHDGSIREQKNER